MLIDRNLNGTLMILLIEFNDVLHYSGGNRPNGYLISDFETLLFSDNTYTSTSPDGETVFGSVRDYFEYQSHGILHITGDVINPDTGSGIPRWLNLGNSAPYYTVLNNRLNLTKDAINAAIDSSWMVNYDIISIILAQDEYSNIGFWTGVAAYHNDFSDSDFDPSFDFDNWFGGYIVKEREDLEWRDSTKTTFTHIGLHSHEMFHVLGWGIPNILQEGTEIYNHSSGHDFSLMSIGYRTGPLRKSESEWATATQVNSLLTNETISYIEEDDDIYANFDYYQFNDPNYAYHYFLVENRQYSGFNSYLPGWWKNGDKGGLLIWLSGGQSRILIHADNDEGQYEEGMPYVSEGDLGDPFPGENNVTQFSNGTTPDSKIGDNLTGAALLNISSSSTNMTADFYPNAWDGTIPSNTTWTSDRNPYYIIDDLAVDEGVTLTVNSGVIVNVFSGDNIELIVNGTLNANGATFQSVDNPGTNNDWLGIRVNNNATIQNCTIKNAYYGIKTYNCGSVTISTNTFNTCNKGIFIDGGGSSPQVSSNTFSYCSGGIYVDFTPASITGNTVNNVTGCGYFIAGPTSTGTFSNNDVYSALNGMDFRIGAPTVVTGSHVEGCSNSCFYVASGVPVISPNNEIDRDGTWSINNLSQNTVNAQDNTWWSVNNYGSVDTDGGTFYKIAPANSEPQILFDRGKRYFDSNNYQNALAAFKELLIKYSTSSYTRYALKYVMLMMESTLDNRENNVDYFKDIKAATSDVIPAENSISIFDYFILYWLQRNKSLIETEQKYDELIEKSTEEDYTISLKLNKACFYIYDFKSPEKAIPMLADLTSFDNIFYSFAQKELECLGYNSSAFQDNQQDVHSKPEADNTLKDNYPNPFNPATTIQFTVKDAGLVTIKVYNVLGQEVKTLVDREFTPGLHQVTWDGRNSAGIPVAGGLYIYSMTAGGTVLTKKMVMIK